MIDGRMGAIARGIYVVSIVGALLIGLALTTGAHIGVMGMAISGSLLVGLLVSDTEPEQQSRR